MEEDIHFLVSELEGNLENNIRGVLSDIADQQETREQVVMRKFTKALVKAAARQKYPQQIQPQQVQQIQQQPKKSIPVVSARDEETFAELQELEQQPIPRPIVTPIEPRTQMYYMPVIPQLQRQKQKMLEEAPVPEKLQKSIPLTQPVEEKEEPVAPIHEISRTIPPPGSQRKEIPEIKALEMAQEKIPEASSIMQPSQTLTPTPLPTSTSTPQPQPPVQRLPTDETLSFPSDAFIKNAPLTPMQTTMPIPSPSAPAPAPLQTQMPLPIAMTVPEQAEPPIALIVDAELKRPIVTVTIKDDIYTIEEPPLSMAEVNMVTWLRKKFMGKERKLLKKKKLNKKIWKAAKKMQFSMQKRDENEYIKMKYYLVKHVMQFGWVEPLLHDELITKIVCEGENIPITIIRKDKTLKTNVTYPSADYIDAFLIKFAQRAYKKISKKNPVFDFVANNYHIEGALRTQTTQAKFTLTKVL